MCAAASASRGIRGEGKNYELFEKYFSDLDFCVLFGGEQSELSLEPRLAHGNVRQFSAVATYAN